MPSDFNLHRSFLSQLLAGVFIATIATAPAYAQVSAPAQAAPLVGVAVVSGTSQMPTKRYPGKIVAIHALDITSRISGEIVAREFTEGSLVKAGDVLYRLDPVRYQAALNSAKAALIEAEATQKWAQTTLTRSQALVKNKAVSQEVLDEAIRQSQTAKASVLKAQADVTLAQDDLNHTTIMAPVAGKVGVSAYSVGSWIAASGEKLTTLVSTDPIRVRFAMSMKDIVSTFGSVDKLLSDAVVTVEKADGSLTKQAGKLAFADNTAGNNTDTLDLYAELPNPDGEFVIQSTVTVHLQAQSAQKALSISPAAVLYDDQGPWVWVLDQNNKASKRRVELGAASAEAQIVTSGLTQGETVVADGTHKVSDGLTVRTVQIEK